MRGSPHLHQCTADCPKLTCDTKDAYLEFIDEHVQANLPSENDEPELHELVKKSNTVVRFISGANALHMAKHS